MRLAVQAGEAVRLLLGVLEALARLARTSFPIVLLADQPPIGRGILARVQVEATKLQLVS